jgi:tetratricopeptide (TPR) repeat protein
VQARGIPYDLFTAAFDDNDRAVCDGEGQGFDKVLTRRGTGKILGGSGGPCSRRRVARRAHHGEKVRSVPDQTGANYTRLSNIIGGASSSGECVSPTQGDSYGPQDSEAGVRLAQRQQAIQVIKESAMALHRHCRAMNVSVHRQFNLSIMCISTLFLLFTLPSAWAQSPLVAEVETLARHYHQDPAQLDRLRAALEQTITTDAHIAHLVALARVSFIWGDVRAVTRDQKLDAYDRGRQVARRVIELAPRHVEGRFWYALNTGRWGQMKGIVRSLFLLPIVQEEIDIILQLDPQFTPVYVLAGHVYYEVPELLGGDLKKAEEMFRTGLAQDPHFTAMRVGLARTLIKLGRYDEARRELQAVLDETAPSNPADWALRDTKEAREFLQSLQDKS